MEEDVAAAPGNPIVFRHSVIRFADEVDIDLETNTRDNRETHSPEAWMARSGAGGDMKVVE